MHARIVWDLAWRPAVSAHHVLLSNGLAPAASLGDVQTEDTSHVLGFRSCRTHSLAAPEGIARTHGVRLCVWAQPSPVCRWPDCIAGMVQLVTCRYMAPGYAFTVCHDMAMS